MYFFQI